MIEELEARVAKLEKDRVVLTDLLYQLLGQVLGHEQALLAGLLAAISESDPGRRAARLDASLENAYVQILGMTIEDRTADLVGAARKTVGDAIREAFLARSPVV